MGKTTLTRTGAEAAVSEESQRGTEALFSRDEVLGGLPGRRAQRLLFEIERRTARLAEQWQMLVALSSTVDGLPGPAFLAADLLNEATDSEEEQPFAGTRWRRELPYRPTIRDLERHAPDWAAIVPKDARARAAIAQAIGRKYRFAENAVPQLGAALALDEVATGRAFQRLYGRPLGTIYAPEVTTGERVRWALAAPLALLDRVPAFWAAFLLLFLLPLPQALLATPIAAADIGALGGVGVLLVVGVLNLVTVGYVAEASARSRSMRSGAAFVGRLGADFLGPIGSTVLTASVSLLFFLALVGSDIGLGRTMEYVTGAPSWLFAGLLLASCLGVLVRGRQRLSLSAMLVFGAVNVVLVAAISVVALRHLSMGNLDDLPIFEGSFSTSRLDQIIGVALMCFFAHSLVPQAARVVLHRDPSGTALIRGSIAGTVCLMALVAVWTVAISGAVPPAVLAGDDGTVIGPLADQIGPAINVLGSILVISALGMTALRSALMLSNFVLERLPSAEPREMELPRLRDRILIAPRHVGDRSAVIGVTYLGLRGGVPHLGVDFQADGELHNASVAPTGRWRLQELGGEVPRMRSRLPRVWIETAAAARDAVRLRLGTRSSVTYLPDRGLRPVDLLTTGEDGGAIVRFLQRNGDASAAEIAAQLGRGEDEIKGALDELIESGTVTVNDESPRRYRVHFGRRRGRDLPAAVWEALNKIAPVSKVGSGSPKFWEGIVAGALGASGRVWLSAVPVLAAFAVGLWIEYGTTATYAHILGFTGVMTVSVFGGVVPPLLLSASRRKGEVVVSRPLRWVGRPAVAMAVYAVFLLNIVLHGLVVWSNTAERGAALAVAAALMAGTVVMFRQGLRTPRLAVELRAGEDSDEAATFQVVGGGRPVVAEVQLRYESGEVAVEGASGTVADLVSLRKATFWVPVGGADSLHVWCQRVGAAGEAEALPALVTVRNGGVIRHLDLDLAGGKLLVPIGDEHVTVEFSLVHSTT